MRSHRFLSVCFALLVVLGMVVLKPMYADPISDFIKDQAKKALLHEMARRLGQDAPTVSSYDAVFPTEPSLPGSPFKPSGNAHPISSQLKNSSDGSVKLPPGDYEFPVRCNCMKHSAHSPSGHLYMLAPIKGRRAPIITALNARASAAALPAWQVQHMSWDLQAGLRYDQLPSNEQIIADQYLPDYKQDLLGSQLDQIKDVFNKYGPKAGFSSFDTTLSSGEMGDIGKSILELEDFQATLASSNTEAGVNSLIVRTQSDATGGPVNTPWSRLNDRVYARMYTAGGYQSIGTFQIRVLPSEADMANNADTNVTVPITSLEGEPQNDNIQPLSVVPISTNGCSITGVTANPSDHVTIGVPVTFTANVEGMQTNDSITWAGTSVPADSKGNSITVTFSVAGSYAVTATCGSSSGSATVQVDNSPLTISDIQPRTGAVQERVMISGSGFTSATSVKFNAMPCRFRVISDQVIEAIIPFYANYLDTSGEQILYSDAIVLTVITPQDMAKFNGFTLDIPRNSNACPDLISEAQAFTKNEEGNYPFAYRDTANEGFPTIGVGHNAVHDFEQLDFYTKKGMLASEAEKKAYHARINASKAGMPAIAYAQYSRGMKIKDNLINSLFNQDYTRLVKLFALEQVIPGFDGFPEEAQIAIMDIAFNPGRKPFYNPTEWIKLKALLNQQPPDWGEIISEEEYTRKGLPRRDQDIENLFLKANTESMEEASDIGPSGL